MHFSCGFFLCLWRANTESCSCLLDLRWSNLLTQFLGRSFKESEGVPFFEFFFRFERPNSYLMSLSAFLREARSFSFPIKISLKAARVRLLYRWFGSLNLELTSLFALIFWLVFKENWYSLLMFSCEVDAYFNGIGVLISKYLDACLACFSRLLRVLSFMSNSYHSGKVAIGNLSKLNGGFSAFDFFEFVRFPQLLKSSEGIILIIEEFIDQFSLDRSA